MRALEFSVHILKLSEIKNGDESLSEIGESWGGVRAKSSENLSAMAELHSAEETVTTSTTHPKKRPDIKWR